MQPKFSVVVIAKNEAETLPRLIKSLGVFRRSGGEIVVVDTGSRDGTEGVARDAGCVVECVGDRFMYSVTKEQERYVRDVFGDPRDEPIVLVGNRAFDFSASRNYAASLASNDMIAMPDCDEYYTSMDTDKINEYIDSGVDQFQYDFVFSKDQFGKDLIAFRHSKFYNRKRLKWVRVVHEVLFGGSELWRAEYLPPSVLKLEHSQNNGTKRGQYLVGLAVDCMEDRESDRNMHYFGRELYFTGRYHSALKVLKLHVDMNKWASERAESLLYMGDASIALGRIDNGLRYYHEAIGIDGSRREPWLRLATHYYKKGDYQRAASYAEAALAVKAVPEFYSTRGYNYTYYPHEILYWAYWWLGHKDLAKDHYDKAVEYERNHPRFVEDKQFFYKEESNGLV